MIEIRDLLDRSRRLESRQNAARRQEAKRPRILTIGDVLRMLHRRDGGSHEMDATWLRLQLEGILSNRPTELGPYDGVDGAWKGEPCFLVAGSRGLKNAIDQGFRFDMLDGFHSIGVNHVLEDYDRFEWFLFQDRRFFDVAKYDLMGTYKGRIFGHVRTRLRPSDRVTIFYTQDDGPSEHIIQGLFTFLASGITAINLALISGADPIYLMGVDNGGRKDDSQPCHYKDDYTGSRLNCAHWKKYRSTVPERCLRYAPYAERFRNVDPLGDITVFKKIGVRDIPELKERWNA